MGDIDGASCTVANVSAYVVKDGEALFLPYEIWHREITANTKNLGHIHCSRSQKTRKARLKHFLLVSLWK